MFITFEGIDGSGKSTQIQLLKNYYDQQHTECHIFREPGGTEISEEVRRILLYGREEMDPVTELLLFSAARSQLVAEKVKPLLNADKVVILDRFYDSTIAYQGYGRTSAPLDEIQHLNKIASHHTTPDITFYLQISPELARARTEGVEKDRMEKSGDEFFQAVSDGFNKLSKQYERFRTVDAQLPVQDVHNIIIKEIQRIS